MFLNCPSVPCRVSGRRHFPTGLLSISILRKFRSWRCALNRCQAEHVWSSACERSGNRSGAGRKSSAGGGGTVSVVYYRAMLCISGTIHSPVSVCVRHKSVFDRNGWTNRAGFWLEKGGRSERDKLARRRSTKSIIPPSSDARAL